MASERGAESQGDEGDDGGRAPDDPSATDPFDHLTLDETFIRAAAIREPTAADRERAARQANLSRLLSDEAAQRENLEYERRRYAPQGGHGGRGAGSDWGDWDPDAARRRRRRPLRVIALLVLVSIVVTYVVADHLRSRSASEGAGDVASAERSALATQPDDLTGVTTSTVVVANPEGAAQEVRRPEGWPPLDERVADQPLGVPGPVPDGGGPHTFVLTQDDGVTPVGYDPCRPVRYRTRPGGPEVGDRMVREAVAMVAAATGLNFVDEGPTDEGPSDERPAYQPQRYGERWAPVLIVWSDAAESPQLGQVLPDAPLADVAGYAGSQPIGMTTTNTVTGESTSTGLVFVTGSVVLDGPDLTRMLDQPDGYERARAIVAHELGHLVGLGHIDDPDQLMHPQTMPGVTQFAPGDLQGLARLGTLDCFPEI